MELVLEDRQSVTTSHKPGEVSASQYLRIADAVEELRADWLWQQASAEGRAKLLRERVQPLQ